MSQFESIHIEGFRRLVNVKLALRPLMVMIGANGCGKSSFLDVWRLLSRATQGQLGDAFSERNGFADVLSRSRPAAPQTPGMGFTFWGTSESDVFDYHLAIRPSGLLYVIDSEGLHWRTPDGMSHALVERSHAGSTVADHQYVEQSFTKSVPPSETLLSRAGNSNSSTESFRDLLLSTGFYGPIDVSANAPIRRSQMLRPVARPSENGDDLVSRLYSLRESNRDWYEVIEDTLCCAFPDFERLEFPPVAAGTMALAWKDRQFTQPLYVHQLSEGTLRFLWLTTLLLSRDLPSVTLIDEPEVSLHPQLLMLLADLMREASTRTQLIVATQSDHLVGCLKPEEVLVADVEDGATTFTFGDDLDLDHWLKDFSLDQLWTMGVLGGRS